MCAVTVLQGDAIQGARLGVRRGVRGPHPQQMPRRYRHPRWPGNLLLAAHFCDVVVLKLRTIPIGPVTAAEPRGNNLHGFKDVYPKAKG